MEIQWTWAFIRYLFALSLVITPFVLNAITLHDGHYWGEDFAQFIICAKNIVSGRPYTQGMLDLTFVFPPGYPLILAPFVFFFGVNFIVLKSLNIVFLAMLVWGAYRLIKIKSNRSYGYWAALLLSWMSYFFILKQHIESDLPFSTVIVWVVYQLERYDQKHRSCDFWRAAVLMSLALLIRSAGSVLFLGAFIYLIFARDQQKRNKHLLILAGVLIMTITFQFSLFGSAPGAWLELFVYANTIFMNIMRNLFFVSSGMLWVVVPACTGLTLGCYKNPEIFPIISFLIIFAFICRFIWQTFRHKLTPLYAVFFVYFTLIVFWTATYDGPVDSFARFMLPAVPLLFAGIAGILQQYRSNVLHSIVRTLFVLLLVLNVWNMVWIWNVNDDELRQTGVQSLFAWVKGHVKQDEAVLFGFPCTLTLMTGVKAGVYGHPGSGIFEKWLEDNNIHYAIVSKKENQFISPLIASRHQLFELEWMNQDYLVYRFVNSNKLAPSEMLSSEWGASFLKD